MKDEYITVCENCLRSACWQGIFVCDDSAFAGTIKKKKSELLLLNLEHPDYMKNGLNSADDRGIDKYHA